MSIICISLSISWTSELIDSRFRCDDNDGGGTDFNDDDDDGLDVGFSLEQLLLLATDDLLLRLLFLPLFVCNTSYDDCDNGSDDVINGINGDSV